MELNDGMKNDRYFDDGMMMVKNRNENLMKSNPDDKTNENW